jgi:hypothetical protein
MIEQRYVFKFFGDEGGTGIEIHRRLKDHYGESALSSSEVYRWIREIKVGERTSKPLPVREGRQMKEFRSNPTPD